jgi:hypothetical protein
MTLNQKEDVMGREAIHIAAQNGQTGESLHLLF